MSGTAENKPAEEEAEKPAEGAKKGKPEEEHATEAAHGSKKALTEKAGAAWKKVGTPVTKWVSSSVRGTLGSAVGLTVGAVGNEGKSIGGHFKERGQKIAQRAREGKEKIGKRKFLGKAGAALDLANKVTLESVKLVPGAALDYVLEAPGRIADQVGKSIDRLLWGAVGKYDNIKKHENGGAANTDKEKPDASDKGRAEAA